MLLSGLFLLQQIPRKLFYPPRNKKAQCILRMPPFMLVMERLSTMASIMIKDGKIAKVGSRHYRPCRMRQAVDAKGKHVYPGVNTSYK